MFLLITNVYIRMDTVAKAKVLTKDEIKRVEKIIAAEPNAARNLLAFKLSVLGGMRVGEIAALNVGQVRGMDGKSVAVAHLSKHQTKGNKARRVFFNDELQAAISKFLARNVHLRDDDALIQSTKTLKHFSNVTLCVLFKSLYRKSGIETSSHSGRRTFATVKNANAVGMRTIQQLMGHKNIQTTALYCDVTDEQLANAANVC